MHFHYYADDTQLYLFIKQDELIKTVGMCCKDLDYL